VARRENETADLLLNHACSHFASVGLDELLSSYYLEVLHGLEANKPDAAEKVTLCTQHYPKISQANPRGLVTCIFNLNMRDSSKFFPKIALIRNDFSPS
jgi:hypothetical protein